MSSHQAMYDFIRHHEIETDPVGNCKFNAVIDYEAPNKSIVITTKVKFIRNGYDDGKIEIGEQVGFQPEDYHLDVTAKWQDYSFSESNGKLTVNGSSPKMGGNYVIQISAI